VSIAALTVMVYGNPDAWVAGLEMHRYRTTGHADMWALSNLSDDAIPTLIAFARVVPPNCRAKLVSYPRRDLHWYEWNARETRAQRARPNSPVTAQGDCPVKPW
jgi:Domain of unknown function (DUF4173)